MNVIELISKFIEIKARDSVLLTLFTHLLFQEDLGLEAE